MDANATLVIESVDKWEIPLDHAAG